MTNIGNCDFSIDILLTSIRETVADVLVYIADNVKIIVKLKVEVTFT